MTVKRRGISSTSKWRGFRIIRVRNSEVLVYFGFHQRPIFGSFHCPIPVDFHSILPFLWGFSHYVTCSMATHVGQPVVLSPSCLPPPPPSLAFTASSPPPPPPSPIPEAEPGPGNKVAFSPVGWMYNGILLILFIKNVITIEGVKKALIQNL